VKQLEFASPVVAGDQELDFGFEPDAILFWTPTSVLKGTTAMDDVSMESASASFAFGLTDLSSQYYNSATSLHNTNPAETYRRTRSNRAVGIARKEADGGAYAEAEFIRMNANGKVLIRWHIVGAVPYTFFALGIKGPRAKLVTFTQPTSNGNSAVTGIGFTPDSLLFLSGQQTAAAVSAGATVTECRMALGAVQDITPAQLAIAFSDSPGPPNDESSTQFRTAHGVTFVGDFADPPKAAIVTMDADGFTLNWSATDATARQVAVLAFGKPPDPTTIPQAFLDWPDKDVVVIAEFTPSIVPSGWIRHGTHTLSFTVAVPKLTQTSVIKGGVYRKVTSVSENGELLTECATAALCNASAGSWFLDTDDTLYVRPTTDTDPDLITAMQVFVTYYTATKGVVLDNGIYYHPWLVAELPQFVTAVEDLVFGVKASASGTIAWENSHAFFDMLIPTHEWSRKTVHVLVGGTYRGTTLTRAEFIPCDTVLIENLIANEQRCVATVTPVAAALTTRVPTTPIFDSEYSDLGEGVRGTRKWFGYGRATMVPDLVNVTGREYLVADASHQTLYAVHNVWAVKRNDTGEAVRTLLTLTTDYTVNLTNCTVVLTPSAKTTYPVADYHLEVDVTGKPDGRGSYLKTAPDIIRDLLISVGVSADDIDYESFSKAARVFPFELAVWLKDERSLASVLQSSEPGYPSIERSCFGRLSITTAGQYQFTIWDPQYRADALALRRTEVVRLEPRPGIQPIASKVRVHSAYDFGRQQFTITQKEDLKAKYLTETERDVDLYTFLRSTEGADLLARRYLAIVARRSTTIELEEVGTRLFALRAGDHARISYPRGPTRTGQYDEACFELLQTTKDPALRQQVIAADMGGFADTVGAVPLQSSAGWAGATAQQRKTNCFVTDASGYVVPGDETTKLIKLLW